MSVTFSGAGNGVVTAQTAPSGANGQLLTVKLNQLSDGQVATIRFRVVAPALTGTQTEKFFDNTAALYNPALEGQVYDGEFTDVDGVTYHVGDPIYTPEEINQESETTYHAIGTPAYH